MLIRRTVLLPDCIAMAPRAASRRAAHLLPGPAPSRRIGRLPGARGMTTPAPGGSPQPPEAGRQPEAAPAGLVDKLDLLVEPAAEPENAVLTDQTRLVRWTGPLFGLFSVILLPWIGYIAITLPARQLAPNYDIAWAGFDVLLFAGLVSTAYYALRRSRYLASAAAATAALLIVDAWFDVMTTPASERLQSIVLCLAVELPLASVCLWLSYHTQQVAERRIILLQRRKKQSAGAQNGPADAFLNCPG